jgi:hypothetical protein
MEIQSKDSRKSIHIKIEEFDNTASKYLCNYDTFDNFIYENVYKNNLNLINTNNSGIQTFKFIESQLLYSNFNEYDSISNRKFKSKECLNKQIESQLAQPYKKQLRSIPHPKKMEFETHFIDIILMNISNITNHENTPLKDIEELSESDIEKSLIDLQSKKSRRSTKLKAGGLRSSLNIYSKNPHNRNESRISNLDEPEFNNHEEFKYPEKMKDFKRNRPAFVENLFKKYNYEDLKYKEDKQHNNTKVKVLNLGVIKDVYSMICNWING